VEFNFAERETFYICGYAIETTAEQNSKDVSALYNGFFGSNKETILLNLNGSKKGYCGLSWYTQGRERNFLIPIFQRQGLSLTKKINLYFEYYPYSAYDEYELWVPVVKANA